MYSIHIPNGVDLTLKLKELGPKQNKGAEHYPASFRHDGTVPGRVRRLNSTESVITNNFLIGITSQSLTVKEL